MFAIPFARWALGRLGGAAIAGKRFLNGEALAALVAVAVVVSGLVAVAWFRHEIVAGRDGVWKDKLAKSRLDAAARTRAREQAANAAAAAARKPLVDELVAARDRVADLEQRLAAAEKAAAAGADPDPVIFSRDIVRSLRK